MDGITFKGVECISNSTAKEMVHAMHQLKEQDNVKKSFQNIKEIDELGRD